MNAGHAAAKLRLRNSTNARRGTDWQDVVGLRLRHLGLEMVAHIRTGWTVMRKGGRITSAYPMAKVHADFTAIVPGTGQSVMCEAKWREDGLLSLGDLAKHQADALTLHAALGGLSLVGWSTPAGTEILVWPIKGLTKGKPLCAGDARTIAARWGGVPDVVSILPVFTHPLIDDVPPGNP